MTTPNFRPMLASTSSLEDVKKMYDEGNIPYSSVKMDGIRTFVHPTMGPVTRTLKNVANNHIRQCLDFAPYHGLDGELIVGDTFQETQSGVMSKLGRPAFIFYVFDVVYNFQTKLWINDLPFALREERLYELYKLYNSDEYRWPANVVILPHAQFKTFDEFQLMYEGSILKYEGVMLNAPGQPYKFGRSTPKEQGLMKLKPKMDDEAVIIGLDALIDKHGVTQPTMGRITAVMQTGPFKDKPIRVGSGFTAAQRKDIWANWEKYDNAIITIEYQLAGSKTKPRQPIFKGFRYE